MGVGKISKNKAAAFQAAIALGRRLACQDTLQGAHLNSSQEVYEFFHAKLRGKLKEEFYAVLLNCKHTVISEELISVGSLNFSVVHPREVFAPAIAAHAGSIILVHNHPSGDSVPSREDIQVTTRLIEVGKVVGIEILDHIVIGDKCFTSFLEQNLLR
jgi:DNA repair protein RadC